MSDDGYARFKAALKDPAAAVALLTDSKSTTAQVMIDVILGAKRRPDIARPLLAAIKTKPKAIWVIGALARGGYDFAGTDVAGAIRPFLAKEQQAAFALVSLGAIDAAVVKRLAKNLDDFDDACNMMASFQIDANEGNAPVALVPIIMAAFDRPKKGGDIGATRVITAFAKAGTDVSAALPKLEKRLAKNEDDYEAEDAIAAIKGKKKKKAR